MSCNSLTNLCVELASCRRLKVLRAEENSLELQGVPRELLENSSVSLLCVDGNLFTQKDLQQVPGYDKVKDYPIRIKGYPIRIKGYLINHTSMRIICQSHV